MWQRPSKFSRTPTRPPWGASSTRTWPRSGARALLSPAPTGYANNGDDCDLSDPAIYPGADEYCDGIDNSCDTVVDEDTAVDALTWYPDADNDGYGRSTESVFACTQPAGYVVSSDDCNDLQSAMNPGEDEICDDLDNDCDSRTDTSAIDAPPWYRDADSDGYGNPTVIVYECDLPSGYVATNTDCNDSAATTYPGAAERCDTVDQDCDGVVADDDAADATPWYLDADADGFGDPTDMTTSCATTVAGRVEADTDCDDSDDTVFPMSHTIETPFDGIDQDCDGQDVCRDLNCDAWPDIVFTNYKDTDTYVASTIYYGGPTGYSAANSLGLYGLAPRKALVEDFDQDGLLDVLLVSSQFDGSYDQADSWMYLGADGHAAMGKRLPADGAEDACTGDFDGDGLTDISVITYQTGNVLSSTHYVDVPTWWGSAAWTSYGLVEGTGPATCAVFDFDLDGYDDLVLGGERSDGGAQWGQAHLYFGDPTTGFSVGDEFNFAVGSVTDLWAGDLDNTGGGDLVAVVANDGDTTTESRLYLGDTTELLSEFDYTPIDTVGATEVLVEDLDADGDLDLAFSGTGPSTYIYHQVDGAFPTADRDSVTISSASGVAAGDLDLDGDLDLVYANSSGSSSYIYWRSNTGYATTSRTSLPSLSATGVAVGDLNGDGYPEIVFSNERLGTTTAVNSYVYWGSSAGYSTSSRTDLPTQYAVGDPVLVGAW